MQRQKTVESQQQQQPQQHQQQGKSNAIGKTTPATIGLSVMTLALLSPNIRNSFVSVGSKTKNSKAAPTEIIFSTNDFRWQLSKKFRRLQNISHPNLNTPVDLLQSEFETTFMVETWYRSQIVRKIDKSFRLRRSFKEDTLLSHLCQLCSCISTLHSQHVYLLHLKPQNVCFDENDKVKVCRWAYYHILHSFDFDERSIEWIPSSSGGNNNNVIYLAPELYAVFATDGLKTVLETCDLVKADAWSIGIIMLEILLGYSCPWKKTPDSWGQLEPYGLFLQMKKFIALCQRLLLDISARKNEKLANSDQYLNAEDDDGTNTTDISGVDVNELIAVLKTYTASFVRVILNMCAWYPKDRMSPLNVCAKFPDLEPKLPSSSLPSYLHIGSLKCLAEHLPLGSDLMYPHKLTNLSQDPAISELITAFFDVKNMFSNGNNSNSDYCLWLSRFLNTSVGKIPLLLKINYCSIIIDDDGSTSSLRHSSSMLAQQQQTSESNFLHSSTVDRHIILEDLNSLLFAFAHVEEARNVTVKKQSQPDSNKTKQPLILTSPTLCAVHGEFLKIKNGNQNQNSSSVRAFAATNYKSILSEDELDSSLQMDKCDLFRKLLTRYPFSRQEIIEKCKSCGIPPVLRGEIWAALLNVEPLLEAEKIFSLIDLSTQTASDRQIAVDVPRSHQYHPYLASAQGQKKLHMLLKAWVIAHKHCAYWQGLDSLCAPILVLLRYSDSLAFCALKAVVARFVPRFFATNGSSAMEERLALYSKMLMYHDPELANHLFSIEFRPELYAIPWFLTLFAHVLPLSKVFVVWDALFVHGPENFVVALAVAIAQSKRHSLLEMDFSRAIVCISSLQDVNILEVLRSARLLCAISPKSVLDSSQLHVAYQQQFSNNPNCASDFCFLDFQKLSCPAITHQELHQMLLSAHNNEEVNGNVDFYKYLAVVDICSCVYYSSSSSSTSSSSNSSSFCSSSVYSSSDSSPSLTFCRVIDYTHLPYNTVCNRQEYFKKISSILSSKVFCNSMAPLILLSDSFDDLHEVGEMLIQNNVKHVCLCCFISGHPINCPLCT